MAAATVDSFCLPLLWLFFFPFSYTLRHGFTPRHAGVGSGARLQMPTNSFVWQFQKIDSRPPNSSAATHALQPDAF